MQEIRAVVTNPLCENPNTGEYYAVCIPEGGSKEESITFSMRVWKEDMVPDKGNIVILSDIRETKKGLRAYQAKFARPDEKEASSANPEKLSGEVEKV